MTPPVAEMATAAPLVEDPIALPSDIGTVVPLAEESWTVTIATTPLPIGLLFSPAATQVADPAP